MQAGQIAQKEAGQIAQKEAGQITQPKRFIPARLTTFTALSRSSCMQHSALFRIVQLTIFGIITVTSPKLSRVQCVWDGDFSTQKLQHRK